MFLCGRCGVNPGGTNWRGWCRRGCKVGAAEREGNSTPPRLSPSHGPAAGGCLGETARGPLTTGRVGCGIKAGASSPRPPMEAPGAVAEAAHRRRVVPGHNSDKPRHQPGYTRKCVLKYPGVAPKSDAREVPRGTLRMAARRSGRSLARKTQPTPRSKRRQGRRATRDPGSDREHAPRPGLANLPTFSQKRDFIYLQACFFTCFFNNLFG